MDYKFYDTCSLLLKADSLFEENEYIVISSVTLNELENIKTSANKDAEVKCAARHVLRKLDQNDYKIVYFKPEFLVPIQQQGYEITDDMKILACANWFNIQSDEKLIFVSNDLALRELAQAFFSRDRIQKVEEDLLDDYCGYKELSLSPEEMSVFYSNPQENNYDILTNEYIILKDINTDEIVDQLCWTGREFRPIGFKEIYSQQFGKIRPIKNDIQQLLAIDSLSHNIITMLKGPAGSGKSTISLGFLFNQLEKGKIDRIIIFCNPVATKNSARLGFYPGTKNEKLLDSQIGNFLSSKLGGRIALERFINEEKIILLPFSDIRGYDTSGMRAGIYITEAQNLDISLMKLALQRIGEDGICILDGDCRAQVDDISFSGVNNGMKRASKVFRGQDIYGEVELKTIHRSRIAQIAEQL